MPDWRLVEDTGPAGDLHGRAVEAMEQPGRTVRVLRPDRPALVLGSHQRADDFDPGALHRAGLDLARRRSGGGAVLVAADSLLWVDFILPAGDPLWSEDVGQSAWWVGDAWSRAVEETEQAAAPEVWKAPMRSNGWSALICFAGVAPGEVLVAGRKVIGVSQRRNRRAALFQTAALLTWQPRDYLSLLSPGAAPTASPSELEHAAQGLGRARASLLLDALLRALPR